VVSEFTQCFFFNLPHALARQVKPFTNLFQRKGMFATDTKIETNYLCLSIGEF
jgi:hypothetical protein